MSEEIELVSESVGKAVGALVEASGLLGPVRQISEYLTRRIYYLQLPTMARVATLAAEKIQRLGLPHASVDDPVVLRILEDAAGAQDETMQERWANLIANAATATSQRHYVAYARILAELELTVAPLAVPTHAAGAIGFLEQCARPVGAALGVVSRGLSPGHNGSQERPEVRTGASWAWREYFPRAELGRGSRLVSLAEHRSGSASYLGPLLQPRRELVRHRPRLVVALDF